MDMNDETFNVNESHPRRVRLNLALKNCSIACVDDKRSRMLQIKRGRTRTLQSETLGEVILPSKAVWNANSTFAAKVLKELRSIKRKRVKDMEDITLTT
ncbi:hypothetical protein J6590_101700 [Homalodisca vitripennis]|nr:hypothetical protein J6590_101700 [Homalodisca vitripennis]